MPRWQKMVLGSQGDLHVALGRVSPQLMSHDGGCSVPKLCPTLLRPSWTIAGQASLSFTISQSLLKLMSIELIAIQPSYPLSSPSPPAFNLSQHQSLFQCVGSSPQVAKVLETGEDLRFSSFPGPGSTALWLRV